MLAFLSSVRITRVKCKYCGHKAVENVTRMRDHMNSCTKVPRPQSQASEAAASPPLVDVVAPHPQTSASVNKQETTEQGQQQHTACFVTPTSRPATTPHESENSSAVASGNLSLASKATTSNVMPLPNTIGAKHNAKIDKFCDRMSLDEQEQADTLFARAVYNSGIALSFTENEHAREFFAFIRPSWKVPSRCAFRITVGCTVQSINRRCDISHNVS